MINSMDQLFARKEIIFFPNVLTHFELWIIGMINSDKYSSSDYAKPFELIDL